MFTQMYKEFRTFDEKEIREIIKGKAAENNCKIAAYVYMDEIIAITLEIYNSNKEYFKSWFYSYGERCAELSWESFEEKTKKRSK